MYVCSHSFHTAPLAALNWQMSQKEKKHNNWRNFAFIWFKKNKKNFIDMLNLIWAAAYFHIENKVKPNLVVMTKYSQFWRVNNSLIQSGIFFFMILLRVTFSCCKNEVKTLMIDWDLYNYSGGCVKEFVLAKNKLQHCVPFFPSSWLPQHPAQNVPLQRTLPTA